MTLGGTPASRRIWTRCQAITGDCSAGLSTTVLPVTSAATVMPQGMARGKFHGGMTTATPRGMCSQALVSPGTSRRRGSARRIISRA